MGTIAMVLLISCANVANLMLVRTQGRQQELAIRSALGAGWWQIARELLVESLLLRVAGGAVGAGLALAALRLLQVLHPADLPRLEQISMDAGSVLFTFAISVFAGLLFGLIPAIRYAGGGMAAALRTAGRGASESHQRHRARNMLVVVQVALALVLLTSAGLMIRTFQALRHVNPGFALAIGTTLCRSKAVKQKTSPVASRPGKTNFNHRLLAAVDGSLNRSRALLSPWSSPSTR